ncbi:hypothetical protein FRC17_009641, partial [Serendipita sp. 399]
MTDLAADLFEAFESFVSTGDEGILRGLRVAMEGESIALARSVTKREELGRGGLVLWDGLDSVWRFATARLCHRVPLLNRSEQEGDGGRYEVVANGNGDEATKEESDREFLLALARFTRNLVAQVSDNQNRA